MKSLTFAALFSTFVMALTPGCAVSGGADAGSEEPVVTSETSTGLSVAASAASFERAGVTHWEFEQAKPVTRVRGYDANNQLVADMSFEQRADKSGAVIENVTRESLLLDASGKATLDQLSPKNRAFFEALSVDATALRNLRAPESAPATATRALEGQPCSKCYGFFLLCGEWEFDIENWGTLECDAQELCGACFGWGW